MKVLVALGGNAILRREGRRTAREQLAAVDETCRQLVNVVEGGNELAVTHGNGPQIGDILLAYESARESLPTVPLDVAGAQSQGMIGYMLQQSLENELNRRKLRKDVTVVLTRTVVSESDPAFAAPSKPIGPFYTEEEAARLRRRGWRLASEGRKGSRRVVPSPEPMEIVEEATIRSLFEAGRIVIAAGGGGVPVVRRRPGGEFAGVEAVVDKDLASVLVAKALGIEVMVIATDVEGIFLDYGSPTQRLLRELKVEECRAYLREGQFPAGSMGPKAEAAVRFVEAGGRKAVVTSLRGIGEALSGRAGTEIAS